MILKGMSGRPWRSARPWARTSFTSGGIIIFSAGFSSSACCSWAKFMLGERAVARTKARIKIEIIKFLVFMFTPLIIPSSLR